MKYKEQMMPSDYSVSYKPFTQCLHPNISVYILHTILYTFSKILTRRNCVNQELLQLVFISLILAT